MNIITAILIDLVAISLLSVAVYFPRHRRRDLVTAFLGVNIGVLAVTLTLGSGTIGAGLGLGLFGVLSIIRLRSDEIAQHEVAYYFAALALGLIAGLGVGSVPLQLALMALIVLVLFLGDHPALFRRYRQQVITLDAAYSNESELTARISALLGANVHSVVVRELNLVNDTTRVEVRYQLRPVNA